VVEGGSEIQKPENFWRRFLILLGSKRSYCFVCALAHPPTARTKFCSLNNVAEKPRRAFQNYPYFGDVIRHLLAISSARDLRHTNNIPNARLIQDEAGGVGTTRFAPNFACGKQIDSLMVSIL